MQPIIGPSAKPYPLAKSAKGVAFRRSYPFFLLFSKWAGVSAPPTYGSPPGTLAESP
jgi:hypothetical protein